jgi:hypothetical protein
MRNSANSPLSNVPAVVITARKGFLSEWVKARGGPKCTQVRHNMISYLISNSYIVFWRGNPRGFISLGVTLTTSLSTF